MLQGIVNNLHGGIQPYTKMSKRKVESGLLSSQKIKYNQESAKM